MRVQELEDELKTVNRRHASNIKVCLQIYLPSSLMIAAEHAELV